MTSWVVCLAVLQICYMTPCSGRQKCDKGLRDDVLALCTANDDRSGSDKAKATCALPTPQYQLPARLPNYTACCPVPFGCFTG